MRSRTAPPASVASSSGQRRRAGGARTRGGGERADAVAGFARTPLGSLLQAASNGCQRRRLARRDGPRGGQCEVRGDRVEIGPRSSADSAQSAGGPRGVHPQPAPVTRPRHVHDTPTTRPRHVRNTSATRPRHVRDTSTTHPRHVTVLPQAALRGPQAQPARREGEGRGSGGARHLCRVLASAGCARRLASSLPSPPASPSAVARAEEGCGEDSAEECGERGCGEGLRTSPKTPSSSPLRRPRRLARVWGLPSKAVRRHGGAREIKTSPAVSADLG